MECDDALCADALDGALGRAGAGELERVARESEELKAEHAAEMAKMQTEKARIEAQLAATGDQKDAELLQLRAELEQVLREMEALKTEHAAKVATIQAEKEELEAQLAASGGQKDAELSLIHI